LLQAVLVRASEDIGVLSSAWARSPRFAQRVPGLTGKVMRRLAESQWESDLLSYLLFDGEFAAELIALGRRDARARHAELCKIFDNERA
jgi:NTE family protein